VGPTVGGRRVQLVRFCQLALLQTYGCDQSREMGLRFTFHERLGSRNDCIGYLASLTVMFNKTIDIQNSLLFKKVEYQDSNYVYQ
jgi:hypothetical protein